MLYKENRKGKRRYDGYLRKIISVLYFYLVIKRIGERLVIFLRSMQNCQNLLKDLLFFLGQCKCGLTKTKKKQKWKLFIEQIKYLLVLIKNTKFINSCFLKGKSLMARLLNDEKQRIYYSH